jgi:hypothetical protein
VPLSSPLFRRVKGRKTELGGHVVVHVVGKDLVSHPVILFWGGTLFGSGYVDTQSPWLLFTIELQQCGEHSPVFGCSSAASLAFVHRDMPSF